MRHVSSILEERAKKNAMEKEANAILNVSNDILQVKTVEVPILIDELNIDIIMNLDIPLSENVSFKRSLSSSSGSPKVAKQMKHNSAILQNSASDAQHTFLTTDLELASDVLLDATEFEPDLKHPDDSYRATVTVFLVPTVPLVTQQANYIRSNSNLRTSQIWGGMRKNSAHKNLQKEIWEKEIEEADVIVMTPDILRLSLDESHVSLGQINLIVFDECHHCIGLHPYNQIMHRHYKNTPVHLRPKIFGMTASPVASNKNVIDSISYFSVILES
jgi:hypothetical protein